MVSKYITTALSIVEDDNAYAGECDCAGNRRGSFSTLSTVDVEESDSSDIDFGTAINVGTARFSITIKTHLIPCYSTYTETELKRCWYSPEEKDKMAAKRDRLISRMQAGKPETRSRPYRGLELSTEEGCDRFTEQVDRIIAGVIDEQDDQWLKGLDDQDRIAAISRSVSAESVEAALHNAHQDAQETIKIHSALSEDTNTCAEDDVTTSATDKKAKKCQSRQAGKESSKNRKRSASRRPKRRTGRENNQQDPPGVKSLDHYDAVVKRQQQKTRTKTIKYT
jgi:hypothetical protein